MSYFIVGFLILILVVVSLHAKLPDDQEGVSILIPLSFLGIVSFVLLYICAQNIWIGGVVFGAALLLLLCYVSRVVILDLRVVLNNTPLLKKLWLAGYALALTSPFLLLAAWTFDVGNLYERAAYYSCKSEVDGGVFSIPATSNDSLIYGRKDGKELLAFALVQNEERETAKPVLPSPLAIVLQPFTHFPTSPCPAPSPSVDYENSFIQTANHYSHQLRDGLQNKLDAALLSSKKSGETTTVQLTLVLFGRDRTQCSVNTSTVFPATLRCQFPIRTRCSLISWVKHTGDCIKRIILEPLHSSYEENRAIFKADFISKTEGLLGAQEDASDEASRLSNQFLHLYMNKINEDAVVGIKRSFTAYRILQLFGLAALLIAILKAYFYIFARLAFSSNGGKCNLRLSNRSISSEGAIVYDVVSGNNHRFSLPLKAGIAFYTTGNWGSVVYNDPQKSGWLPKANTSILKRLRTFRFPLNKYTLHSELKKIAGRHDQTAKMVVVEIDEHQVVIDISRLAGFSEGVKFKTAFNPKLSSFLQHKLFFTVAYGTGKILLNGSGGTITKVKGNEAVPPEDILAMDYFGTYSCKSQIDVKSVYTQPFNIQSVGSTFIISHRTTINPARKLLRKLKNFFFFFLPV